MERKKRNGGFTLAELLVVVAIIAVLVAIAIPVFSTQLEKAREATDLANIRSAYAEMMTALISEDKDYDTTQEMMKLPNGEYWDWEVYPLKSNSNVYTSEYTGYSYFSLIELKHKGEWELENAMETLQGLGSDDFYVIPYEQIVYNDESLYALLAIEIRDADDTYPGMIIYIFDEKTLIDVLS